MISDVAQMSQAGAKLAKTIILSRRLTRVSLRCRLHHRQSPIFSLLAALITFVVSIYKFMLIK